MGDTPTIRAASEGDFDALTDLWERSARSTHGFMEATEFAEQRPRIRDLLLPSMDVWLAETDDALVGFVGAREAVVELLYVSPDHQGRGVGATLLSYVDGGAGPNSVEVFADNVVGVGFYRARGFVEDRRYLVQLHGASFDIMRLTKPQA